MKRLGISKISLSMIILVLSIVALLLFSGPLMGWFSKAVERAYLVGGQTSIEVVAASGIGTDEPLVYVRNLGPKSILLGYDRRRDPSLWQVFIGDENFKVLEVEELGREDNLLSVYEILCLRLEGKKVSGAQKRVIVYGPGATMADPPVKAVFSGDKARKDLVFGTKKRLTSAWSLLRRKVSSSYNWIKGKVSKAKEYARRAYFSARSKMAVGRRRLHGRYRYGRRKEFPNISRRLRAKLGSTYSLLRRKAGSAVSWLKRKAVSTWNWCKRHKKDIAIVGGIATAVAVAVFTAGAASPGVALAGTKGAAVAGFGSGTVATALSYAGGISISPHVAALLGFTLTVASYELCKIAKIPRGLEHAKTSGPLEQRKELRDALDELKKSPIHVMNAYPRECIFIPK